MKAKTRKIHRDVDRDDFILNTDDVIKICLKCDKDNCKGDCKRFREERRKIRESKHG